MADILVLGDSHTYGHGLKDAGLEKPWKEHSKLAWPYFVFDKNRIINKARSGCCNDIIAYNLVRYSKNIKFVAIMFSWRSRYHFIRNGYNFIASPNFNISYADNGNEDWVAKQYAKKFENEHKDLISYFSYELMELHLLRNILFCQNFCQANYIDFIFTTIKNIKRNKIGGSVKKIIDSLYKNINWNKFYQVDKKYGFEDYAKKIGAKRIAFDGDQPHFDEEYHKTFGKKMKKYLETKIESVLL